MQPTKPTAINKPLPLHDLMAATDAVCRQPADNSVSFVTADSRRITSGALFVAIEGARQDGRAFIAQAVAQGAAALLVPTGTVLPPLPPTLAVYESPDTRLALSALAARFYPRQPAFVAALTGTSGKTSTAQFTMQLWESAGFCAGSLGTLGLVTRQEKTYGSLTTPDPVSLHETLDHMVDLGVSHLAMEASSVGILQKRLDHVKLKAAAFTNLSRDHLDDHGTMEAYLNAKMRLFSTLLPAGCPAVLNADIPEFDALQACCRKAGHTILTYGRTAQDLRLIDSAPLPTGQRVCFTFQGRTYDVVLPVLGSFQIANSLCALGIVLGSGVAPDTAIAGLEKLTGVPGRLQLIGQTASGGTVFVDYAHKPGALENVLTGLRPHVAAHAGAKLGVVFGCGGNRDTGKRPMMGQIAQRLADWVIVTDDNPRSEVPESIRRAILDACVPSPNLREIGDRAEAIHQGIAALRKGDVLVIAGKGHEVGQIIGDTTLPFDDCAVARAALGQSEVPS